jgi:hypothetical protein
MLTILFSAKTATYMILPILHQGINAQVPVWDGSLYLNNRLVSGGFRSKEGAVPGILFFLNQKKELPICSHAPNNYDRVHSK